MGPTQLAPILVIVRRARARIRIQRMLEAACTALIPASGLALVGAYLAIAGIGGGAAILVAAGALLAGAITIVAARPISDEDVAGHLDHACGLADRLRTALVFARAGEACDFMHAAIRDGARTAALGRIDVVRATPFHEPANARTAAICAAAAAILACVGLPDLGRATRPRSPDATEAAAVDEVEPSPEELVGLDGYPKGEVEELIHEADAQGAHAVKALGEQLLALLEQFEQGELGKERLLELVQGAEARAAAQLGDPANELIPAGLRGRLADVHEAIARLQAPPGDTAGDKPKSIHRTPPKDRLLTLQRKRPRVPGALAPPQPPGTKPGKPGPPGKPGKPGPGGANPGPTGGIASGHGTDNAGPLGDGADGAPSTTPGGKPSSGDGGREAGRGTAPLTLTPPAGPRGDGTHVIHAVGKPTGATSTRTTIIAAASKGFASSPYRDVFTRYRRTADEVMHGEKLPSSYRYFVKRYFWSIRPETSPGTN